MCLGMDHVMKMSSYVSWGKVSVLEAGVMFVFIGFFVCLFGGVLCCLILWGFFSPLGFFLGI